MPRISAPSALAGSVLLGLLAPPLAELARPLLFPSLFFLMLLSMVSIDLPAELRATLVRRREVARIALWQMVGLPLLVGVVHRFSPLGGELTAFAFFTACAGTLFGAPAFAVLLGVDRGVVLRGVLAATLLMPLTLPPLAAVIGAGGALDLFGYLWRLAVFLLLPMAIGWGWRRVVPEDRIADSAMLRRGPILFLGIFALAVMDGVGPMFVAESGRMAALVGTAFAVHWGFFGATRLVFLRAGRNVATAAALLAAYRNLGLLLAVAGPMLPADFIVFVAVWQLPMYVTPLLWERVGR